VATEALQVVEGCGGPDELAVDFDEAGAANFTLFGPQSHKLRMKLNEIV
jgi:hypothetical protein